MNDISNVLRRAAIRLWVAGLFRALVLFLSVGLTVALGLRIAQQLLSLELAWVDVAIWLGAGAVVAALVYSALFRESRDAVARRVDEGAQLREAISTALCVHTMDDPWSRATVASAAEKARAVRVRHAVPISAPRYLPVPMALCVALLVVWIALPRFDFAGLGAQRQEKQREQTILAEARKVEDKVNKIEEQLKEIDPGADGAKPEAIKPPDNLSPEEVVTAQIQKISDLRQRAEAIKAGEKGQTMEAIKDALQRLKSPGQELSPLTRALAQGNFKAASDELAKMQEQLESGEMSEEQKQAMADQMQALAEQLKELAENREALEEQLEKLGLDKNLAASPEALKEALEKMNNLSEEQKQQLQEMAKSMNQACSMCQGMSGAMNQMAQAMQQGQQGEGSEGMEGMEAMSGQLSQMEMLAQELAQAESLSSECMSQLAALSQFSETPEGMGSCEGQGEGQQGTRPWASGWKESPGNGAGGPGQGRGGDVGQQQANTKWKTEKFLGEVGQGRMIGTRFVEGEGIRNESVAEFRAAVEAAEGEASDAIEQNVIPKDMQDVVKRYFGRLKAKTEAETAEAPAEATEG